MNIMTNSNDILRIRHKATGKEYTDKGFDFFDFDRTKFDIISSGSTCTDAQRHYAITLMNGKGKNIVDLLQKYNKKNLKEFNFEEMEKIIKFLERI